jgi:hypothetical protein
MEEKIKKAAQTSYTCNFSEASKLPHCSFLSDWFRYRFQEIVETPEEVIRRGLPKRQKGETYHPRRPKLLLVLLSVVYQKPNLKGFSKEFGVPYGTVKNWRTESNFEYLVFSLQDDFLYAYVAEVENLIKKAPKDNNYSFQPSEILNVLISLFREATAYQNHRLTSLLPLQMEQFAIANIQNLSVLSAVQTFYEIFLNAPLYDPKITEEIIKTHSRFQKYLTAWIFTTTSDFIKDGQTDKALKHLDFLNRFVTNDLIEKYEHERIGFLLINKIRRKSVKDITKDGNPKQEEQTKKQ